MVYFSNLKQWLKICLIANLKCFKVMADVSLKTLLRLTCFINVTSIFLNLVLILNNKMGLLSESIVIFLKSFVPF